MWSMSIISKMYIVNLNGTTFPISKLGCDPQVTYEMKYDLDQNWNPIGALDISIHTSGPCFRPIPVNANEIYLRRIQFGSVLVGGKSGTLRRFYAMLPLIPHTMAPSLYNERCGGSWVVRLLSHLSKMFLS
jgi:hypothetical protein